LTAKFSGGKSVNELIHYSGIPISVFVAPSETVSRMLMRQILYTKVLLLHVIRHIYNIFLCKKIYFCNSCADENQFVSI